MAKGKGRQKPASRSRPVIVFDPCNPYGSGPNKNGWHADFVTDDWEAFKKLFWSSRECLAVLDEFADVCEADQKQARMIMRRGRHQGHDIIVISQDWMGIEKQARGQVNQLFCFRQRDKYAAIEQDWIDAAGISDAVQRIDRFHYFDIARGREPKRGVVPHKKHW
ncbi:hypothetical protein [Poriferisphaera sp. WC338]|uniref:hypothetical protein n=1 Tax=Poriferisphaera sp. WC338 TaxID=3425129 RepID=UPI003D813095